MNTASNYLITGLVLALHLSACESAPDGEGTSPRTRETIDAEGIRVVENLSDPKDVSSLLPVLELVDLVPIGGAVEEEDYLIPSAAPNRTKIAIGPSGHVGVVDLLTPQVCVYDSSGNLVWKGGRLGEGPGEFRGAQHLQYLADTGWIVLSFQKYHIFSREGVFVDTKPIQTLPFHFGASRFHFMPSGELWYRHASPAFSGIGEWALMFGSWRTLDASKVATGVIQERTSSGGKHFLTTYPFCHAYSDAGTVWFNSKVDYEIEVIAAGSSDHWRIRRNHRLRKYTQKEREQAEMERVGQIGSDPIYRRLTTYEPAIQGMNWVGAEELWVFTTIGVDSSLVRIDVFNPAGVFLHAFAADASLRYAQISTNVIWRLDETADGFPILVRSHYRIRGDH